MEKSSEKKASALSAESLLLTAQRKLIKPRIQNKLILAFVSTAVISIAISTYLVVRITSQLAEQQMERKIREAGSTALSVIDQYEEQAVAILNTICEKPGFADTLKKEKVPYLFTPPISAGSEAPIGLWVPSGQPAPDTAPPSIPTRVPLSTPKTIMETEVNGIQTLLAGAVMSVIEGERQYGTLAVGYVLGKSFAQDLEIMTGAAIRIFHETIPTGPSKIFFKGSSSELPEAAVAEIGQIASIMRELPKLELIVEGHTDSTGSEKQNYRLGLKRAEAVKDALISKGIVPSRIQTISFGETRAIAPEASEEGRAMNRRVELEFKSREATLVGAIKDLPMTSAIKQSIFVPRKYTFQAAVGTWHFFPVILGVGFILATMLGYTISRGISRPIRHLYRGVLAVADGDLDQHFEAETKDEIGDLGRAFNIMTKKLRQLRELEEEMQRRNRLAALGELSAGVAHEIRNPLGIIKNSAEMLRDRIQDDSKRRELTGYIVEEVDRLNRVVTNFLQFARPAEPNREIVDINAVLKHTISFIDSEARSANISIEKSLATDLPPVLADPEQCHQVFLNLCVNAFQAMDGAGTLKFETRLSSQVSARTDEGSPSTDFSPGSVLSFSEGTTPMVDVLISDTGEGMSPDVLARVFDPFFSTKDEGVGLGLSLVHKIIENHSGRIRVTSKQSKGTTFVISLPTAGEHESAG
jgi:signal transduction histidine kinase